ncbi:MAG: histidinol dehydrogenase [Christensenellales bacterium]|jgi:histidinol dehydrogenase
MKLPVLTYGIDSLDKVLKRSQIDDDKLIGAVGEIVNRVRKIKDAALFEYTLKFDKIQLDETSVKVSDYEIEQAYKAVDDSLIKSLRQAKENILNYHINQRINSDIDDATGYIMRPVERAGIYIPGGTAAYPSSVLMCALPAVAAGVNEIIMTTPRPENPLTLVAAEECGIKSIFKVGGAQAIAAMAFGTESVPRADIIAGPGNVYVTLAKKLVYGHVGIDMIAGPSEILIIADDTANPDYIIADMLSQAEHDIMSASILITDSESIAQYVSANLYDRAARLKRADIIIQALNNNAAIIKVDSVDTAIKIADMIAPEHLELNIKDAKSAMYKVRNAGAIFIGNYSPEPLGDYFAGPSHVLPTSGTARFFSALNTMTFMKRISVINYDKDSLDKVSKDIIELAECEGLDAHAESIRIRS